jgi:hypothetical protein
LGDEVLETLNFLSSMHSGLEGFEASPVGERTVCGVCTINYNYDLEDGGGHVLWDTTSLGLCGLV